MNIIIMLSHSWTQRREKNHMCHVTFLTGCINVAFICFSPQDSSSSVTKLNRRIGWRPHARQKLPSPLEDFIGRTLSLGKGLPRWIRTWIICFALLLKIIEVSLELLFHKDENRLKLMNVLNLNSIPPLVISIVIIF